MAKDGRNRLVIAPALDAPGRKTMAKGMKPGRWDAYLGEESLEIIPVVARLKRGGCIGNNIEIVGHNLAKRPYQPHKFFAYGNIPDRGCRLRLTNRQSIFLLISIGKPDPLDGFSDMDLPCGNIQILPLQGTDFSDAQAAV